MITNHEDWKKFSKLKNESVADIKYVFPDMSTEDIEELLMLYNGNSQYVEEVRDDLEYVFDEMTAKGKDPYSMTWEEFYANSSEIADLTHTFKEADVKAVFDKMVKDPKQLALDLQSKSNESVSKDIKVGDTVEIRGGLNKGLKGTVKSISTYPPFWCTVYNDSGAEIYKFSKTSQTDCMRADQELVIMNESRIQPIHNHNFTRAKLHTKLRNELTVEMGAFLPTGYKWEVKKWGKSNFLKVTTTEGKAFKFNIGLIDETMTAKRIAKMVKSRLKLNESKMLNESSDQGEFAIEEITDKDWFKAIVADDFLTDYRLDNDTDHNGEVALLYVPAMYLKFDIKDKNAIEWASLQRSFTDFLKSEHSDLYPQDIEVTCTSDYSDLVFSFTYQGDEDESKIVEIKRDNMHGGSAQGISITDYLEWKQTVIDKFPSAEFVDNGDTEGAYADSEHGGGEAVGYWDKKMVSGVVFDSGDVVPNNGDDMFGEMITTHAEFKAYLESKKAKAIKESTGTPYTREELGKAYEEIVGYDISVDDPTISADGIVSMMKEYDDEDETKPFAKYYTPANETATNEPMTFEALVESAKAKLPGYEFSRYNSIMGDTASFHKSSGSNETMFDFSNNTEKNEIFCVFSSTKIIEGAPLADPTKNFRTTSATRYKTAKKKYRNYVPTPAAAYSKFEKFLAAIG